MVEASRYLSNITVDSIISGTVSMIASRRALLTFAFVSESLKTHHDLIVGLAPLFNPIASDYSGKLFDAKDLSTELARRYDLPISADVAEYMSFSLQKVGLLRRKDVGAADTSFFWSAPAHPTTNASLDIEDKIEKLADALIEFSDKNPSLLTWNRSRDEALNLIFDWVIEQDKELQNAEIAYEASRGIKQRPTPGDGKKLRSEQEYFCTRFIAWLRQTYEDLHDTLADLGNAVLVSEVVLELRTGLHPVPQTPG